MSLQKSNTALGIGLMLTGMLIFPFLDVIAKKLGQDGLPVLEAVWARLFLGSLMTLPLLVIFEGPQALKLKAPGLNAGRGLAILFTTFFFFSAIKFQGIAQTLSLYFIQPILVTALAPLVLRETVGLRRWLAVAVGFVGVIIIIRPGLISLTAGAGLALASGFTAAFVVLLSRKLAGTNSALGNTFYTSFFGAIACSAMLFWQWQWPTSHQWLLMLALAAIGTFANYVIIRAFEHCEASLLAPFGYAEMVNAVLAGWYFFGDFPDFWTFVGVGVLIGCAIVVSRLESAGLPEIEAQ